MSIHLTRHVEFDAGHRVPDHASKCRHPHGHRYRLDVTVTGDVQDIPGESEHGMVMDFGVLGDLLSKLADEFDHRFLVAGTDDVMLDFLIAHDFATFIVDGPPTAEVLVRIMARAIMQGLPPGVMLTEATLWETPKCRATLWS